MSFDIRAGISPFQPYLAKFEGIDTKIVGPILLGTVPMLNKILVPFWAGLAIEQIGGLTTAPTISIGTNASAYDNMVGNVALTGLLQGRVAQVAFKAQYPYLLGGNQVYLNIVSAAVATTYTIRFEMVMLPG